MDVWVARGGGVTPATFRTAARGLALGLSAAWLVPMHSLTSYWPLLVMGAIGALILAKRRMACDCKVTGTHSLFFWMIVAWTGLVSLTPVVAPLFY